MNGKSVVIYGSDELKDAFTQVVGNIDLPQQVQEFLSSHPPHIDAVGAGFGGGLVTAPHSPASARASSRILVAVAQKGKPLVVGYAPTWRRYSSTRC